MFNFKLKRAMVKNGLRQNNMQKCFYLQIIHQRYLKKIKGPAEGVMLHYALQ